MFIVDNNENNWYKLMSLGSALFYKIQSDQEELERLYRLDQMDQLDGFEEIEGKKEVKKEDKKEDRKEDKKENKKEKPKTLSKEEYEELVKRNRRLMDFIRGTKSLLKSARTMIEKICDDLGIDKTNPQISSTLDNLSQGADAVIIVEEKLGKIDGVLDEKQLKVVLQFLADMINGLNNINLATR